MTATPIARPADANGDSALPPCLYCAGNSYDLLFENLRDRLGYVQGRWSFWQCRECGSATLSPFPSAAELVSFYPSVYSFTPDLGREGALKRLLVQMEYRLCFKPLYDAHARRVLKGIEWEGSPGQRLLDVGCGRGFLLRVLRGRGFHVHGMDFQPEIVEYLQRHLGIPAVCTDIAGLSRCFAPASFDVITAFYVLEHVHDVATTLRTCFQLLKPGGWFVGAVPFMDGLQVRLFKARWINFTEAPRHLSIPSRDGMTRACKRVGFDRITFRPDSALHCAGAVGLSLVPRAATTYVYGGSRFASLLTRLAAGAVAMLSIPFCVAENHLVRRPSLGMVFCRKTGAAHGTC